MFLFLFSLCFCFSFQLSLSQQIYICAVQFSQPNLYICVLFGESTGFSPRWDSLSLSLLTFCTVYLCTMWGPRGGECPWVTLWQSSSNTKPVFRGLSEFHPTFYTLTLYPPTPLYLSWIKNPSTSQLKCHRTVLLGSKQWPKGLPGRRRLHQQISTMCATLFVFANVTLIKSTHSLLLLQLKWLWTADFKWTSIAQLSGEISWLTLP